MGTVVSLFSITWPWRQPAASARVDNLLFKKKLNTKRTAPAHYVAELPCRHFKSQRRLHLRYITGITMLECGKDPLALVFSKDLLLVNQQLCVGWNQGGSLQAAPPGAVFLRAERTSRANLAHSSAQRQKSSHYSLQVFPHSCLSWTGRPVCFSL